MDIGYGFLLSEEYLGEPPLPPLYVLYPLLPSSRWDNRLVGLSPRFMFGVIFIFTFCFLVFIVLCCNY